MPELLAIAQSSFIGGMIPDRSDLAVTEDQSEFLANVALDTRPHAVEQIKGATFFNAVQNVPDSTTVLAKSLYRFYKSTGTAQTIVSWQQGAIGGISIVDALSETLISNSIGNAITDYAVFQDILYMVNGTSTLYIWDGTNFSSVSFPTVGTAPFAPTFIEMQRGRAYYAGDAPLPSTVIWSDVNLPASFNVLNFLAIADDDGDQIRGLVQQGGNIIVFKERKTYVIEGSPPQRIEPLPNGTIGCINQKTIQKTTFGIIFLGHGGVYLLNGTETQNISAPIRQQMRNLISTAQSTFSSAFHKGVYNLYFRPFSAAIITEGLSFNLNVLDDGAETVPIVKLNNVNVEDSAVFNGAIDSEEFYACMSGTNNIIRVDGSNTSYYLNQSSPNEPIESIVVSRWFDMGSASREKEMRELYIYFHDVVQNMRVSLQIEHLGTKLTKEFTISENPPVWDTALWDVALWGERHVFSHRITLPAGCLCNRVQLRFSVNGVGDRLNLDGFEIKYLLLPEV